nr:RNA-directed DNA polymerase, eukaryota [Tanacetum cinerariifolium]
MENMDLAMVKMSWGNFGFDYVHSDSVGNSGCILCVWDVNSFRKVSHTVSDYFVMIRGVWLKIAITLERYLSDHRPILLRESHLDYGPTPFRFYHNWLEIEGFDKLVEDTWRDAYDVASNAMCGMALKLKYLKSKIREWIKSNTKDMKSEVVNSLQDIKKLQAMEMAQKAKIKWCIEGDENSSFFHDAGIFKGIKLNSSMSLSHMFYADDAVFVCHWCDDNINTLIHVLECFYRVFGLRINMSKSKIMGVLVAENKVKSAATKLGCLLLNTPFTYLGTKVGGSMARSHAWEEVINKLGNGNNISFWADYWIGDDTLNVLYLRLYALENSKHVYVSMKLADIKLDNFFRRMPRGGIEHAQFTELSDRVSDVILLSISDRWIWSLEGSGEVTVASIRREIDDKRLSGVTSKTRWIKSVLIKVNIHAWKVMLDALPRRLNISRRGIVIDSILCPICDNGVESSNHLFLTCNLARQLSRMITHWWDTPQVEGNSYDDWWSWLLSLRLSSKYKRILEGIFYVMW